MRRFYLISGRAIVLLALLAISLTLFVSKASAKTQQNPLPQVEVLAPHAIQGTPTPLPALILS